jgi:hypothetical protein
METMTASAAFGVYILTYPGDFHLSVVLVQSIQKVSPSIPIMVIPGEGFDREDHPFHVPIMPEPPGRFWPQIGHQDRKVWAFQGPFEKFLYLDADTICTKSLDHLSARISRQQGDFLYVQCDQQGWRAAVEDPCHPQHDGCVRNAQWTVGTGPLQDFDPEYDFLARRPFNSGVFASRRLAITESDFEALNHAERKFYHDYFDQEAWTWKSSDLFFRDQGRLNYLAVKLNIPAFPLTPDLICRSGGSATVVSFDEVERGTCTFHVVHWTGVAPNPSFFCSMPLFRLYALVVALVGRREGLEFAPGYEWLPERVGFSLWRHYYEKLFGPLRLRDRLTWSRRELKRLYRRSFEHITRSILGDRQTT